MGVLATLAVGWWVPILPIGNTYAWSGWDRIEWRRAGGDLLVYRAARFAVSANPPVLSPELLSKAGLRPRASATYAPKPLSSSLRHRFMRLTAQDSIGGKPTLGAARWLLVQFETR